jgi:hypothetical protein
VKVRKLTRAKAIHQNCFDCIYDPAAAGTNRQQVTLYSVRPTTDSIPASVYEYYGEEPPLDSTQRLKYSPEALFSEKADEIEVRGKGET